jgi:hypothetical protein
MSGFWARVILSGYVVFSSDAAFAHVTVLAITSPHQVQLHFDDETLRPDDRLIVRSKMEQESVGYLQVTAVDQAHHQALAEVIAHQKSSLIMVGDEAEEIDFTASPKIAGRADLMPSHGKDIPIRYRRLFYLGQGPSETAQTLNAGENGLAVETYYSYGLTDNLTVQTVAVIDALGLPILGAKYKVYDNDDFTVSVGGFALYYPPQGTWAEVTEGFLDVRSNSKFISHTQLTIFHSDISASWLQDQATVAKPVTGSYFQSVYEYVLDDWDRVLAGPSYDLDRKTLGGLVGYVFLWKHFQLTLGVHSDDFTNLRVNQYGYQPRFDMFWIF